MANFDFVADVIGVPFLLRGRDPQTGWDCLGLVEHCQPRALDVPAITHLELYADAPPDQSGALLLGRHFKSAVGAWQLAGAQAGALVLFRRLRVPFHVGLYLGDDRFLHVTPASGTVISELSDPNYGGCFADFYLPR